MSESEFPERFVNLNRFLDCTLAEGPGRRFCLWTQGCLQRCPNCCNAQMQALEPRQLLSVSELCSRIQWANVHFKLEGVTFLGGEPFLQAHSLARVAHFAHSLALNVLVFTGYERSSPTFQSLPGAQDLLSHTDVLIDGPYQESLPDETRSWVGSQNQRFHYLTATLSPSMETDPRYKNLVELRMDGTTLKANGCPKTLTPFR